MYRIFGEYYSATTVYAALAVLAVCLLAFNLRVVLFLTILALLLPSLNTPLFDLSRLLRWAFLAGLLGKGLALSFRRGLRPRPFTGVHLLVTLLALLVVASWGWSIGRAITLAQGGMMLVVWAVVFLVLWNAWDRAEHIVLLCDTLYWLAFLLFAGETVYLIFGLGERMGDTQRYAGIFSNPNGLGMAVAFLGPFVYWKLRTVKPGPLKLATWALSIVMAASLWSSGSRSGMLGTLVCLGFMLSYVHRFRAVLAGFVVGVPLLAFVVFGSQLDPTTIQGSHVLRLDTLENLGDRLPMWEEGFYLWLDRPVLGYGYGMSKFAELGRADVTLALAVYKLRGANYHNAHLQLALDIGALGVLVFWIYLAAVLRRGIAIYRRAGTSAAELAGIAFFAAFLALTGDTFVHGWAFSPGSSVSIVFWLVAGAVVRVHILTFPTARETEEERTNTEAAEPRFELVS